MWLRHLAESNSPGVGMEFDGDATLNDRNEMRDGDVVEHVASDGSVDAANDKIAIERLPVSVLMLYSERYGAYVDVSGRGAP